MTFLRHKDPVGIDRGIGTIFDRLQVSSVKVTQKLPCRIFHFHLFRSKNFAPSPPPNSSSLVGSLRQLLYYSPRYYYSSTTTLDTKLAISHGPTPVPMSPTIAPTKAMLSIRAKTLPRLIPQPCSLNVNWTFINAVFAPSRRTRPANFTLAFAQSFSTTTRAPRIRWQQPLELEQHRRYHPTTYRGNNSNLDDLCKNHINLPVDDFADGCREFYLVIQMCTFEYLNTNFSSR